MSQRVKNLVLLGSTGSIGQQALELVRSSPDAYRVLGLSTGSSCEQLVEQAREFDPEVIGVAHEQDRGRLKKTLSNALSESERPEVVTGPDGLETLAGWSDGDIVLNGIMGAAGLPGTLAAVRADKRVALANKESLLVAGSIIRRLLDDHDAELIPVDSEHSALFQLLNGVSEQEVERLILTASGGPFRTWTPEQIQTATAEDALNHPTWDMGEKITIDSATMMNKAIELVEAKQLFDVKMERLDVVVHPQSTVHAMLELTDGSMVTHMGPPDMTTPIRYAFTYPERQTDEAGSHGLSLTDGVDLTFEAPREDVFPALELGYYAGEQGGTSGAVLNGANEVAVQAFLDGKISFPMISEVVRDVLFAHDVQDEPTLDTLLQAESNAREAVKDHIRRKATQTKEQTTTEP